MKKDEIRLVKYEGKVLRYAATFSLPKYMADQTRQFIISFFLSDKTVKIFEPSKFRKKKKKIVSYLLLVENILS